MTWITFNVIEARNHLLLKGFVYTLRTWNNYPSICNARYRINNKWIDIGRVKVTKILDEVSHADQLMNYYFGSGFDSPWKWWNAGLIVHGNNKFVLYKVEGI